MLIIEDDPSWRKALRKHMNHCGILQVEAAESSEAAWASLSSHRKPRYDLILLDWQMPKVNGLTLLNRIRKSDTYSDTPILIVSGYLQPEDLRLFEEFPLTSGIAKPASTQQLATELDNLMREFTWFKNERHEIIKIFQKIETAGPQALFQLRQLVTKSPRPNAVIIAAAKLLIYSERYLAAEELLSYFLDDTPDSLVGMNQLAKVYLHTRRYQEASYVLEKAKQMSPKNLERLCILGDAKLHSLQLDEAQRAFSQALDVDKKNLQAQVGRDFAAIIEPNLTRLSDDAIPAAYSSLLNSRGIIASRAGHFDDAIEHYRNAMVYTLDPVTKGRVAFNLGLAYIRWQKTEEAAAWLQRSLNYSRGEFHKASKKLAELTGRQPAPLTHDSSPAPTPLAETAQEPNGKDNRRLPYIDAFEIDESNIDQDIEEFERIEIPSSFEFTELLKNTAKKSG